jgi:hypothetical protein
MQSTTAKAPRQRKPRAQPARTVRLVTAPTEDESGVLLIVRGTLEVAYFVDPISSDYGRAFSLQKFDGEEYAVNLGDNDGPPICECMGHSRWQTECKHLGALRTLVSLGLL